MSNVKTNNNTTKKNIPIILFSFFSALGCMLFGYIFLPFAAGMYASLLIHESSSGRLFSFILPITVITSDFFVNGILSTRGVAFILVGALLYAIYKSNKSKAESAFWLSLIIFLLFIFELALIAIKETGTLSFSSIISFWKDLYHSLKQTFISHLTSISQKNEFGIIVYSYNSAEAEIFFIESLKTIFPFSIIFAFLLSGFTLKIFSNQIEKLKKDIRTEEWTFLPSSFVAYFYLIISLLSIVADTGILAETIFWIELIFSVVFAYMGFKFFKTLFSSGRGSSFIIIIIVLAVALLGQFAYKLLTYIGVYFTTAANRAKANESTL